MHISTSGEHIHHPYIEKGHAHISGFLTSSVWSILLKKKLNLNIVALANVSAQPCFFVTAQD